MRKELVIGLILVLALVGYLEYRWRPVEAKMLAEPKVGFIYPIPCSATLSQRGAGEQWVTKCYVSTSARERLSR